MNTQHLNEAELQHAADQPGLLSTMLEQHLSQCINCQIKVENYRAISAGLVNMESQKFDFDLSGLVMAALPEKKTPYRWVPAFAGGFGLLLIAITVALFASRISVLFNSMTSSLLYMIIIPAAVLLAAQLIAIYNEYQRKMNLFINS